jgi:hypothetical protein
VSTLSRVERRQPRRRRRRLLPARRLLAAAAVLVAFAVGVAVGMALHDNPQPGITSTSVRTLHP